MDGVSVAPRGKFLIDYNARIRDENLFNSIVPLNRKFQYCHDYLRRQCTKTISKCRSSNNDVSNSIKDINTLINEVF